MEIKHINLESKGKHHDALFVDLVLVEKQT